VHDVIILFYFMSAWRAFPHLLSLIWFTSRPIYKDNYYRKCRY